MTELARLFSDGAIGDDEWRTARGRLEERLAVLDRGGDETRRDDRRAYSIKETARLLHLGTTTVNNLIKAGDLKAVYVGGRVLIPDRSITEFLDQADTERQHHRGRRSKSTTPTPPQSARGRTATKATPATTKRSNRSEGSTSNRKEPA
jgi:excisionase family DNA binding protein